MPPAPATRATPCFDSAICCLSARMLTGTRLFKWTQRRCGRTALVIMAMRRLARLQRETREWRCRVHRIFVTCGRAAAGLTAFLPRGHQIGGEIGWTGLCLGPTLDRALMTLDQQTAVLAMHCLDLPPVANQSGRIPNETFAPHDPSQRDQAALCQRRQRAAGDPAARVSRNLIRLAQADPRPGAPLPADRSGRARLRRDRKAAVRVRQAHHGRRHPKTDAGARLMQALGIDRAPVIGHDRGARVCRARGSGHNAHVCGWPRGLDSAAGFAFDVVMRSRPSWSEQALFDRTRVWTDRHRTWCRQL
jgi:hypothetical protein